MSQRAAWQLEQLGFADVHDFVAGKAYWLASGRPTVRATPIVRVGDQLVVDVDVVGIVSTMSDARGVLDRSGRMRVIVVNEDRIVLGTVSRESLEGVAADTSVVAVMRVGPTTIRPDEDPDAVRQRMRAHHVEALIVTEPTGRLLGLFDAGVA